VAVGTLERRQYRVVVSDHSHAGFASATDKASYTFEPREGPAAWRSVVTPHGGQIAFWQPKPRRAPVGVTG
jgi:hypothetical protein